MWLQFLHLIFRAWAGYLLQGLIPFGFQAEDAPASRSYPRLRQRTGQKFVMEEEVAEKTIRQTFTQIKTDRQKQTDRQTFENLSD